MIDLARIRFETRYAARFPDSVFIRDDHGYVSEAIDAVWDLCLASCDDGHSDAIKATSPRSSGSPLILVLIGGFSGGLVGFVAGILVVVCGRWL